jgi:hypothetical protein
VSNEAVPVDVVGRPSRGDGLNPGIDTFSDLACDAAADDEVLITVFLFLSDIAPGWNCVTSQADKESRLFT